MNVDNIYSLFLSINEETFTPAFSSVDLKEKIKIFVENNANLKDLVQISIDNGKLSLYFKPFDLRLTCNESAKLYNFPPIVAYCQEMDFTYEKSDKEYSLIKIYITPDGYIMRNLFTSNDICKTDNQYCGRKVFDELLDALIRKELIVVKKDT